MASVIFLMLSHLNMQDSAETPGMMEAMKCQSSMFWVGDELLYLFIGFIDFCNRNISR